MTTSSRMDHKIKTALIKNTQHLEPSAQLFVNIMEHVEHKPMPMKLNRFFGNRASVFACGLLLVVSCMFLGLPEVRTTAAHVLNSIKSVFIFSNHEVLEKPANQVYITPAVPNFTEASDSDLSVKMGVPVAFPQTVNDKYTLSTKMESVGVAKPIDYKTFMKLKDTMFSAIEDETSFKSLDPYTPYRSVGCNYQTKQGAGFSYGIFNHVVPVEANELMKIIDTTKLHIKNVDATLYHITFTDYKNGDLTQRPTGENTAYLLSWTNNNTMFQILAAPSTSFDTSELASIASAFIKEQK